MSRILGADVRLDARGFYYRYPAKLGNSHGCIKDGGTPVPQRLKEYWRTHERSKGEPGDRFALRDQAAQIGAD
ncbi:hypothetical protein [Pseudomonas fluorescens]|uniref:hypothetical protein n=1 Tax=Pseudomonas fluorescens TaxID=294 RepID=UPI0027860E2E|nr:hypothetical protein [Pseudomonas fluorescens]MDP9782271.1 hypothetical protein [Pseudomonas fluorescens]